MGGAVRLADRTQPPGLLPWGRAAAEVAEGATRVIPLPVPVEASPMSVDRQPEVVAYAGWLWKRGIDILCAAWALAAPERVRLVIGGADRAAGLAWLDRCGVPEPRGIEWAGAVPHDEWLARVARARAFVNASRREDHGLAQLEALAAGTPLITVPSPGAYEALPVARSLAPELVAADVSAPALAAALRVGLALTDRKSYAARAAAAMAPYRRDAVLATVRDEVAPALGLV